MPGKVLVTGGAGFIGSHVVRGLLARGEQVVVLDNFDAFYARAIKLANIEEAGRGFGTSALEVVEGDIADARVVERVCRAHTFAGVIHLAGRAGVRPSLADPAGYMHTNATGTSVVLACAHRAGVPRVVCASSSSVYGNPETSPFHEELDVSRPISPYAASKRAAELGAYAHWRATRQPVAMLRFFTVFGPRQRPDLAIMSFMRAIARGEPITLFGDGTTARDYTFVEDTVAGVLSAMDRIERHGYRVWNLGNHKPVTLARMVEAIEQVVGKRAEVRRAPMQAGDVERTCADVSRAASELGYEPRTGFEAGLAAQWAWLRERM